MKDKNQIVMEMMRDVIKIEVGIAIKDKVNILWDSMSQAEKKLLIRQAMTQQLANHNLITMKKELNMGIDSHQPNASYKHKVRKHFYMEALLEVLKDNKKHSVPELAQELGVSYNILYSRCRDLDKNGIVEFKKDDYGKFFYVRFKPIEDNPKGLNILPQSLKEVIDDK